MDLTQYYITDWERVEKRKKEEKKQGKENINYRTD